MARRHDKSELSSWPKRRGAESFPDSFAPLMRRVWVPTLACALLVAGCGGDDTRQDEDEPSGEWTVEVVDAEFAESQRLARQEVMRIRVRNTESRAIPNIALTVDGLSRRSEQAGLADPNRPVWVVDDAPRGGDTAYTNTWALGRVPAGETKTFTFRVTPVKPGTHQVRYRVSAGLDGRARARLATGERPEGSFSVRVSRAPSQSRVDPDTGEVIRGGEES
jgi:hypothetical protein